MSNNLREKIDHVVVVMFENRSFDHLFGFLNHPSGIYGLSGSESNPISKTNPTSFKVSPTAKSKIHTDPGHNHKDVMDQLFLGIDDPYSDLEAANNLGFYANYAKTVIHKKSGRAAADIMKCFSHVRTNRFLKTFRHLALEYAICDHWFCSVPGATWPNRQFVHAATSHGKVDNSLNLYKNRTIYEAIADHGLQWRIYKDGPAQSQVYFKLWFKKNGGFTKMSNFQKDVKKGKLANYVFIEPRHFKLWGRNTNDMHPGNNDDNDKDFRGADNLLHHIYTTLRSNKTVWDRTLLVVTFDEHGGFYDQLAPPVSDLLIPDSKKGKKFKFNMLGPRVPTLLISPYISRNTVDSEVYDHTSIIKTARDIFGITKPLTRRDQHAASFDRILGDTRRTSRSLKRVPISKLPKIKASSMRGGGKQSKAADHILNDLQMDMLEMTEYLSSIDGNTPREVEQNHNAYRKTRMRAASFKTRSIQAEATPLRASQAEELIQSRSDAFDERHGVDN